MPSALLKLYRWRITTFVIRLVVLCTECAVCGAVIYATAIYVYIKASSWKEFIVVRYRKMGRKKRNQQTSETKEKFHIFGDIRQCSIAFCSHLEILFLAHKCMHENDKCHVQWFISVCGCYLSFDLIVIEQYTSTKLLIIGRFGVLFAEKFFDNKTK